MKNIITLSILLLSGLYAFSQRETEFLKNKLYIVKTEYPSFDSTLKDIMTRLWNLSEIGGYITRKELKHMTKSNENSFLNPTTYNWIVNSYSNNGRDVRSSSRSASGLFFYQGKPKDGYLADPVNVAYFGGYAGDNFDSSKYRLELMIRGIMNEFIYASSMDSIKKKYNLTLLRKKKILLLNTKYFNEKKKLETIAKDAFEDYPYKLELASSAKIEEYIKAKNPKYVLAVPIVNDATRQVLMMDVETGLIIGGFQRTGVFALPIRSKDVDIFIDKIDGGE